MHDCLALKNCLMKRSVIFLIGLWILTFACSPLPNQPSNTDTATSTKKNLTDHELWSANNVSRSAKWGNSYTQDAIKVFPDSRVVNGLDSITLYYEKKPQQIDTIFTIHQILAHKDKKIIYEIGGFTSKGQSYKHLLVKYPAKNQTQAKRAFEFIAPTYEVDDQQNTLVALASRRIDWEKRCNAHDVENLVKNLYTNPPLYYNHRPLVTAQEALIKVYGYMSNPKYSLFLEPLAIEIVNPGLVFEIGQCRGSYGGKYIFIWKLGQDGHWRVLLDGNL